MRKSKPWIHGSTIYREKIILLQQTDSGWRAKIELDGVDIITTTLHPTARIAEDFLLDKLYTWTRDNSNDLD